MDVADGVVVASQAVAGVGAVAAPVAAGGVAAVSQAALLAVIVVAGSFAEVL